MHKTKNIVNRPAISYLVILVLAILSGFWWLFEQGDSQVGGILLIFVWVMALNHMPEITIKSLKTEAMKYFFLPLVTLATVGYVYGTFFR